MVLGQTAGTRSDAPAPSRRSPLRRKETLAAWLFVLPDTIGLGLFVFIPMVLAIVLGFFNVDGFGHASFVGFGNYVRMFNDPQFVNSAIVTLIYLVVLVPAIFVVSLALALLVQQRIPFIGAIRSALFVPYVISLVVIALVWQFMLADKIGVVPKLLAAFGIHDVSFLGDPSLALGTVIVITVWFQMGYYMIIFLAGLQDIPEDLYEAARIDGAGPWQRFRAITFPLLRPTSFFVAITATIAVVTGGLDLIYVLTGGGPSGSTSLLIFYIYEQAFLYGELGYAAAIGSLLVLVLLLWSLLMFKLTKGGRFDND